MKDKWLWLVLAYALVISLLLLTVDVPWGGSWEAQRPFWRQTLTAYTVDDGFYYLKIAQNVAQGMGPTFDGLHQTNGYHPLWLWLLVPIFWLTNDIDFALLLATVYQLIFFLVSVGLLYHLGRQLARPWLAAVGVLVWILLQFGHWMPFSGMEYGLQLMLGLLLAVVILPLVRDGQQQPWPRFLLGGIIAALTLLARLDNALLILFISLMLLWQQRERPWQNGRLWVWALPILVVGGGYAAHNLTTFGSLTPFSGTIKYESSLLFLQQDPLYQSGGWLQAKLAYLAWPWQQQGRLWSIPFYLGTIGVTIGMLVMLRWQWRERVRPLLPFIAYSLCHWLIYVALYHGGLSYASWYYAVPFWLLPLFLVLGLEWVWSQNKRATYLFSLIGIVVIGTLAYTAVGLNRWQAVARTYPEREVMYQGALWAADNLPDDAVIGSWNAGMLGYFSQRTVVNLDGLVNHPSYYQTARHDLCRYWQTNNITYLVDVFDPAYAEQVVPLYYAAETAVSPCREQLTPIWLGPSYPSSQRGIAAYTIDPAP